MGRGIKWGVAVLPVALGVLGAAAAASEISPHLQSLSKADREKISAAFGYEFGLSLHELAPVLDQVKLFAAARSAMAGQKPELDGPARRLVIQQAMTVVNRIRVDIIRDTGRAFLENNKGKPAITTLDSGVQYELLDKGTGKMAKPGSRLKVNYRIVSLAGVAVQDTFTSGNPVAVPLDGFLKAIRPAIQALPVGGRMSIYIPSGQWNPDMFPVKGLAKDDVLVYEVELLEELFDFSQVPEQQSEGAAP